MASPPAPVAVFISHASADAEEVKQLEVHLTLLKRQGLISTWHAGHVLAGEEKDARISAQLDAADVILLLALLSQN